jgi:hypothetical protein
MKYKLIKITFFSLFFATAAPAAVSFTGNFSSNLKNSTNTANVPVGNRFVIIVDSALNGLGFGASTSGVATAGSLAVGQLFGGDEIIATGTIGSLAGRAAATVVNNLLLEVAPYAGKQFALVWFDTITNTTAVDASNYGFFRDAGWIIPSAAGSYGFAASGSDFIQGTAPGAATLSIGAVPEPSRMILLGFGLLGVFFRRRR